MSNFTFPAGNEGDIVTNTETGEKYILTDDAWVLYHGDHPDFVNVDGDSMTGYLTLHANPTDSMHAAMFFFFASRWS